MKGVVLQLWNPPPRLHFHPLPSLSISLHHPRPSKLSISAAAVESAETQHQLTARERRRLRNERREGTNWKEEVEMKLIQKPKKENKSWMDELNLDNLIKLGPQWWVVRASRIKAQYTAQILARSLARNFPDMDFKVSRLGSQFWKQICRWLRIGLAVDWC